MSIPRNVFADDAVVNLAVLRRTIFGELKKEVESIPIDQFKQIALSRLQEQKIKESKHKLIYLRDKKGNSYHKALFESLLANAIRKEVNSWGPVILKINQRIHGMLDKALEMQGDNTISSDKKRKLSKLQKKIRKSLNRAAPGLNTGDLRKDLRTYFESPDNLFSTVQFYKEFAEKLYPSLLKVEKNDLLKERIKYLKEKSAKKHYFAKHARGRKAKGLHEGVTKFLIKKSNIAGLMPRNTEPAELKNALANKSIYAPRIQGKEAFVFDESKYTRQDAVTARMNISRMHTIKQLYADTSALYFLKKKELDANKTNLETKDKNEIKEHKEQKENKEQKGHKELKEQKEESFNPTKEDNDAILSLWKNRVAEKYGEQVAKEFCQKTPENWDLSFAQQMAEFDFVFAASASATMARQIGVILGFFENDLNATEKKALCMAMTAAFAFFGHHGMQESFAAFEGIQKELGFTINLTDDNFYREQVLASDLSKNSKFFNKLNEEFANALDKKTAEMNAQQPRKNSISSTSSTSSISLSEDNKEVKQESKNTSEHLKPVVEENKQTTTAGNPKTMLSSTALLGRVIPLHSETKDLKITVVSNQVENLPTVINKDEVQPASQTPADSLQGNKLRN